MGAAAKACEAPQAGETAGGAGGRRGRSLAVYTDHAGHFGQRLSRKGGSGRTRSIIVLELDVSGVEVILAGSPQAKGRVERSVGTA